MTMNKSLIWVILALSVVAPAQLCGDCDGDGRVTVLDALTASRHGVGATALVGEPFRLCDVDSDGDVDVLDALLLAQEAVGLSPGLSCVSGCPTPLGWLPSVVDMTAPSPEGRTRHAMAFDSNRGVIVIFGGFSGGSELYDTWELGGTSWTRAVPTVVPTTRQFAAMTFDPIRGVAVMFGGFRNGILTDGTWEWDGVDWVQRFPVTSPPPTQQAAMAFDSVRGVSVMFGGIGGHVSGPWPALNSTWEWDGVDWVQRFPATSPRPRTQHRMVYDSNRGVMVVYGGSGPGGLSVRSETWEYDGVTWRRKYPVTNPGDGQDYGFAFDPCKGTAVLFGGQQTVGTWEYDGVDWYVAMSVADPGRIGPQMAFDSSENKVVMFGGVRLAPAGYPDDLWSF